MQKKKSIIANFAFQLSFRLLSLLVPFITAPYLTRTLGVKELGIFTYYNTITFFFVLFTYLGMENYGAREIAKIQVNNKKLLSEKFCTLLGIKMIFGFISLTAYLLFVFFFVNENQSIAIIFSLYIVSGIIDINWFYIGMENFKLISLRNMVVKLVVTAMIFIFVKSQDDLNLYTLIMVCGSYLLTQFIGWGFIIKNIHFTKPHFREMLKTVKPLFILFVPILALQMYRQIDKIMLGGISGTDQVGIYEYTEKIYMICISIVDVFGDVGMPRMVSYLAVGNKKGAEKLTDQFVDLGMCLSFGMSLGIAMIAHQFITLYYGEQFSASGDLLTLFSPSIVFLCVSIIVRKEYLIPYGKESIFVQASIIGVIINFVLNMILIPNYAARGAIIATVVTEFFVMIYQLARIRKELPIRRYLAHAVWFFISGIVMSMALYTVWGKQDGTWTIVIEEILLGIVIYAVFTMVFIVRNYRGELNLILERIKRNNIFRKG